MVLHLHIEPLNITILSPTMVAIDYRFSTSSIHIKARATHEGNNPEDGIDAIQEMSYKNSISLRAKCTTKRYYA